jgi:hypothetical protein
MKKDHNKMTMKDKRKYISNIARRYSNGDKKKRGLIPSTSVRLRDVEEEYVEG